MDFDEMNPYSVTLYFVCALIFTMTFMHPFFVIADIIFSSVACLCICRENFLNSLKYRIVFFCAIIVLNPLFTAKGNTVLFRVLGRPYTAQALLYGFILAGIFICSINWFSCFGSIVGTDKFMYMAHGQFPTLCSLISMITGLIPYFENSLREISQIQDSLFGKKEKYKKAADSFNAAVSFAFEHAVTLSFSMKNRGYGAAKQTKYKKYHFGAYDTALCIASVLCFTVVAATAYTVATDVEIIPSVVFVKPDTPRICGMAFYIILLSMPLIFYIVKEIRWYYLMSEI